MYFIDFFQILPPVKDRTHYYYHWTRPWQQLEMKTLHTHYFYFNVTINNSISLKIKCLLQMLGQTGCCDKRHKLALCKAKSGKGIILEKDKRGLKKGKGNYTF